MRTPATPLPRLIAAATFLLLVMSSCGSPESFKVSAEVEDLGVETLTMVYTDNHGMQRVTAHPKKAGEPAILEGNSPEWTLASLRRSNGKVIATFPARNGDKITATIAADGKVSFSGTPAVDSLSALLSSLHGLKGSRLDNAVAAYIEANPASVVSAVALCTLFDAAAHPARADSLYRLLEPTARPEGIMRGWADQLALGATDEMSRRINPLTLYGRADSTITFVATAHSRSLIAFTGRQRSDSVGSLLHRLRKAYTDRRLGIIEISLESDSLTWNAGRDTARWQRAWMPGGAVSPALRRLSVPRTPFFIVTDSNGLQIYRGPSAAAADTTIRKYLKE